MDKCIYGQIIVVNVTEPLKGGGVRPFYELCPMIITNDNMKIKSRKLNSIKRMHFSGLGCSVLRDTCKNFLLHSTPQCILSAKCISNNFIIRIPACTRILNPAAT